MTESNMYSLKQYYKYEDVAVIIPDGMYSVKSFHGSTLSLSMGKTTSRCGGRLQEIVTCSSSIKNNEKENTHVNKVPVQKASVLKGSVTPPATNGTENVSAEINQGSNTPVEKLSTLQDVTQDKGSDLDIEKRQENILKKLEALQKEVNLLSKQSGISLVKETTSNISTSSATIGDKTFVVEDIVVNADPDRIPLSLFIVLHQLSQNERILTTSHVHSSVIKIDESLRTIFQNGPTGFRNNYRFAITVVWKKEGRLPSIMVKPHQQTLISGEANIARYLSRLIQPGYDSGDPLQTTLIDNWIDVATHQLLNGSNKEKGAAVRNLNSRLGNNQWLTNSFSLADIVMWSAVSQSGQLQDSPSNVKEWYKSCDNLPQFQLAKSLSKVK